MSDFMRWPFGFHGGRGSVFGSLWDPDDDFGYVRPGTHLQQKPVIDMKLRTFKPGEWWVATHGNKACPFWSNCTNKYIMVVLPDRSLWDTHARGKNCAIPEEKTHRCWVIHGKWPKVTIDSHNGLTCNSGAGSVTTAKYHGFLDQGVLTYSIPSVTTSPVVVTAKPVPYKGKGSNNNQPMPTFAAALYKGDRVSLVDDVEDLKLTKGTKGIIESVRHDGWVNVTVFQEGKGHLVVLRKSEVRLNIIQKD